MFTGEEDHEISFEEGAQIIGRYRTDNPNARQAVYFSKKEISRVLELDNCVGIRIYFGYDDEKELQPIIVGVDENENDLVGSNDICLDLSLPCPNQCSEENILNS